MPRGRSSLATPACQPSSIGEPPTVGKNARLNVNGHRSRRQERRASGDSRGTDFCHAGHPVPMCSAAVRGPAPSGRFRFFLLRPSGVRSALCALQSQPLPAILQPFLPTGFAPSHRAGTAVAAACTSSASIPLGEPCSRPLSLLTRIFHGSHATVSFHRPQKEEGAGGSPRPLGAPRFLSPISPQWRQGDEFVHSRSGVSRAAGRVGRSVSPLPTAGAAGRGCDGAIAAPLGPVRADRGDVAGRETADPRWLHALGGCGAGARDDNPVGAADRRRRSPRQGSHSRPEPDGAAAARAGGSVDRASAGA